jgi:hypothetical protein
MIFRWQIFRWRTNFKSMAHPLRDRNFRLLFTGRVVDELGDAVSPAALTLAIVIATRSSAGLALVLACALLPKVALLPIGGVVAGRRPTPSWASRGARRTWPGRRWPVC